MPLMHSDPVSTTACLKLLIMSPSLPRGADTVFHCPYIPAFIDVIFTALPWSLHDLSDMSPTVPSDIIFRSTSLGNIRLARLSVLKSGDRQFVCKCSDVKHCSRHRNETTRVQLTWQLTIESELTV